MKLRNCVSFGVSSFLVIATCISFSGCNRSPANLSPVEMTSVANRQASGRFADLRALIDQTNQEIEQGQLESAIQGATQKLATRWQEIDDDAMQELFSELAFTRGLAYLAREFPQIAIADFDDAIKFGNNELRARAYVARAESNLGLKRWSRVVEDATESIRLEPGNARAFLLRGQALEAMALTDRAQKSFAEATRLDPTIQAELAPTLVLKPVVVTSEDAARALADQNAELARELVQNIIAKNGSTAENEILLAKANLELADYDRVIAAANRAIQVDPQQAEAYRLRGVAQLARNRWDSAILDLSTATTIDETLTETVAEAIAMARSRGGMDPKRRAEVLTNVQAFADSIEKNPNPNEHDRWLTELIKQSGSASQSRQLSNLLREYVPQDDPPLNWLADYLMLDRWTPGVRNLRIYLDENAQQQSRVTQLLWKAVSSPGSATKYGVNLYTDLAMYAIGHRFHGVLQTCLDERLCSIDESHLHRAIDCDDLFFIDTLLSHASLSDREVNGLVRHCVDDDKRDHARLIISHHPRALNYQVMQFLGSSAQIP